MLILIAAAAGQIIYDDLKAPKVFPPFTAQVEAQSRSLEARVSTEHEKCRVPFGNSAARYVEAMGTPANSAEWNRAKLALHAMIESCRGERLAARAQSDFMQAIVANGAKGDADIARDTLGSYTFRVKGLEDHLLHATLDYNELVSFGRGRNKDGTDPNARQ